MIWHDPDKFFFDDSDVPDTNVGEFAKDTDVPSKLVTNQNRLTNGDKLRAMSDEELAEWLYNVCCIEEPFECPALSHPQKNVDCREIWLDWLKAEVDE